MIMQWQPIETAPKGQYVTRTIMRGKKQTRREDFVAPRIMLALDGKVYVTTALPDGRWNGMSVRDLPTHWMPMPKPPAAEHNQTENPK